MNPTLTTCLRCGNEGIDQGDNFCFICGAPLVNKCYGQLLYDNIYCAESSDALEYDRHQ